MKAAVFLDRDDTLIHNRGDLGDPDGVRLIQGAASAIASLRGLGYAIVVVSNQGGVARGKYTEADVEAVHRRVAELVKANTGATIDRFYFCPYHPQGTVEKYRRDDACRKPRPGMLQKAAKELGLDLARSWMIGDQMRDVQAGAAVGARTILVRPPDEGGGAGGLSASEPGRAPGEGESGGGIEPTFRAETLIEAVKLVAQMPQSKEDLAGAGAGATKPVERGGRTPRGFRPWDGKDEAGAVETGPRVGHGRDQDEGRPGGGSKGGHGAGSGPSASAAWSGSGAGKSAPIKDAGGAVGATGAGERVGGSAGQAGSGVGSGIESGTRGDTSGGSGATPASDSITNAGAGGMSGAAASAGSDPTLRQILQELRNLRSTESEFSYLSVFAIVLQMIAFVCLLGALAMSGADLDLFIRWISCGLAIQLATIAILLFRR